MRGKVSRAATGGGCGPGALPAAFSKAATAVTASYLDPKNAAGTTNWGDVTIGVAIHAVVGGTAAELGGGKFANGAQTGAFSYLFNFCAHNGCFDREFTLSDAIANWRGGGGAPITDVGANELNLSGASFLATKEQNVFQVNLAPQTGSYWIYGTVTGVLNDDGSMSFRKDTYNYDLKDRSLGETALERARLDLRNKGKDVWDSIHGPARQFDINFLGSQQLPADTLNRLRNCSRGATC